MIRKIIQWLNVKTCPYHEFHCIGDATRRSGEVIQIYECAHCGKIINN